jgi:hypothetical protein
MQQPPSAISERLRAIRRRVTVGVLATFVAAWLAVAALGKTGKSTASSTPAPATTAPQSATDPYAQPYDDGGGGLDDDGSGAQPYDDGGQQGFDDGGQQSGNGGSQQPDNGANSPGPVTTQQS